MPVPDTIEQHKAGKLKILGVSATERHYMAPDVPTFKEQGFDVVVGSWRCIVGPKGMPDGPAARFWRPMSSRFSRIRSSRPRRKRPASSSGPATPRRPGARWKSDDAKLYPILLEAGLVKARQK